MKYIALLVLFCGTLSTVVFSQTANYWQQQVNYSIEVSLDDKTHSLDAFATIDYTNNSPDTLHFIWFHIWPNAYKNDRTAFSEQLLTNGRTDFYFAADSMKGYINRLEFKVNGSNAVTEAHPQWIDVLKIKLPAALAPKQTIRITTPFHVQLPYNFSRGGHIGQTYQLTQWYPKPAVYDSKGWHPMPYLDQGEFYSEFGTFNVRITLPDNYLVAATGELQTKEELQKLQTLGTTPANLQTNYLFFKEKIAPWIKKNKKEGEYYPRPSSSKTKTLHYTLQHAHDFAWFASKNFLVKYDSMVIHQKNIQLFSFFHSWDDADWNKSLTYAKNALAYYSERIGTYPYTTASIISGNTSVSSGGMEYPSATLITTEDGGQPLDAVIAHELGHNWFYGALASNERMNAWMDEGMNTYYQQRYEEKYYGKSMIADLVKSKAVKKRLPDDPEVLILNTLIAAKKDQPIHLPSDSFSSINYSLIVYIKAGLWMKKLEQHLGKEAFDKAMKAYFTEWQGKHPQPQDFKKSIEESTGKNLDEIFQQLHESGKPLSQLPTKKQLKLTSFFSLKDTDKNQYISVAPLVGYNNYDKLMIGGVVHNYTLPLQPFQFVAAPLYATGSKTLNFFGRAGYNVFKKRSWLEGSLSFSRFTFDDFTTANDEKLVLGVSKIVPSIKYTLYNKDARSKQRWVFHLQHFLLNEENLFFQNIGGVDVVSKVNGNTNITRLSITSSNNRILYPYDFNLTVDRGKDFVRAGFTGNYFFNYPKANQGIEARIFAGKFFYTTSKTFIKQFETDRYHLNMSGPRGYEDYTYSGYFIGRSEFDGWQSQQMMQRDGFFKVGTDLLSNKVGKTDDWLIALNLSGDIPDKINPLNVLPFKLPLKLFVDVGTYSEAWKDNAATGKFVYDAGIQVSLFRSLVNVYVPILYSKVYSNYYKSTLGQNRFWKTISFTVNLQKLQLHKLNRDIPL